MVPLGCTVGEPVGEGNPCGPLGVYSGCTCTVKEMTVGSSADIQLRIPMIVGGDERLLGVKDVVV